ncbi:MAG TPA: universal stress protein [Candidatus Melainabacteria bacterium]|nr:universal stress protein [Candidatus Melainabacteria bacterium]
MSKHSILLALSGSEQARNAAEVAWLLAKRMDAEVTGVHVIDKNSVWELLRNDTPGFVGGGQYIEVYDNIIESLKSLGETLSQRYRNLAEQAGVKGNCIVKEGNTISVLTRDSRNFDMVVLGHVPSKLRAYDREFNNYVRHSIAEGLAHESAVPVLIVQSEPVPWDAMTIVSEIDHINVVYIRSCLKLARMLGLKPALEFWGTGVSEESPESLRKNLLCEIPEAQNADLEIEYFCGHSATERKDLFHGAELNQAALLPSETLFVLPTRGIARNRITVFGIEPEEFIRSLALPCLLLWPEDHKSFILEENCKNEVGTAG